MTLRVPKVVANAAEACGADWWLRDLAGLIAELEAEWSISVGRTFPHASEAFVAEASLGDGSPAVLKLLIPQDGAAGRHEITMLQLAGGKGCVGLLRHDAARGALLLERLGPPLFELGLPLTERLEILVTTASAVWRPAAGSGLPTGADKVSPATLSGHERGARRQAGGHDGLGLRGAVPGDKVGTTEWERPARLKLAA